MPRVYSNTFIAANCAFVISLRKSRIWWRVFDPLISEALLNPDYLILNKPRLQRVLLKLQTSKLHLLQFSSFSYRKVILSPSTCKTNRSILHTSFFDEHDSFYVTNLIHVIIAENSEPRDRLELN